MTLHCWEMVDDVLVFPAIMQLFLYELRSLALTPRKQFHAIFAPNFNLDTIQAAP